MKINEYRLVPNGSEIFSINNQLNFTLTNDVVVSITNTCNDSTIVFVKFGENRGTDQWSLNP